jgi:hypothetical protein
MKMDRMIEWIGAGTIDEISAARKKSGEIRRERKLGTAEMIFLFLSLAFNTERKSIREILRQCSFDSGGGWSLTPAGFSKGRARFSPRASAQAVRNPCRKARSTAPTGKGQMEGIPPGLRRQDDPVPA